jgi:hypothetical protein
MTRPVIVAIAGTNRCIACKKMDNTLMEKTKSKMKSSHTKKPKTAGLRKDPKIAAASLIWEIDPEMGEDF